MHWDVSIPVQDRQDEVGCMAQAVQVFKQGMIKSEQLARAQESDGLAKKERARHLEQLVRSFESKAAGLVGQVTSAATELQATAYAMSSTAAQVLTAAEELSRQSETLSREVNSFVEDIRAA